MRGSGIGKRDEEGGTNRETAIRKGDVERERAGKKGGKQTRESAVDRFVPVVQKSFSSFGKTSCFPLAHFFLFLGASCTSSLSSLSPFLCPLRLLSVSMFYHALLPSVCLSTSLTPSPHVFRWPLLSAFLLPLCSTCVLPGCISSSPASPIRY